MDSVQVTKGQRYRFSLLIQELKGAETEEYVACILAFINCLIAGAPDISARIRLRNEVIGKFLSCCVIYPAGGMGVCIGRWSRS